MTDLKRKGATKHEEDTAERFGGRMTRGSGSTWYDKGDGRNQHDGPFALAWDCKSTRGQSISITRAMLDKLVEESHGERPVLPLRYYDNDRLDVGPHGDWVVVLADDFSEILDAARQRVEFQAATGDAALIRVPEHISDADLAAMKEHLEEVLAQPQPLQQLRTPEVIPGAPDRERQLSEALAATQEDAAAADQRATRYKDTAEALQRRVDELERENDALQRVAEHNARPQNQPTLIPEVDLDGDRVRVKREVWEQVLAQAREELRQREGIVPPQGIPGLPWTVVYTEGGRHAGIVFNEQGHSREFPVDEVRTEPTSSTTQRLMVNNQQVRRGDLYIGGKLALRVGA